MWIRLGRFVLALALLTGCSDEEPSNSSPPPTSACDAGYFKNAGGTCVDIDECATGNGGCAQLCTNSLGSFACSCDEGFTDANGDGSRCDDIDECATDNGGCHQLCSNFDGGYVCDCTSGYALSFDGVSCDDIDECATNNGGCAQVCANSVGSFDCSCDAGFTEGGGDGSRCDDIDECATDNGGCAQHCVNQRGSFACRCQGAQLTVESNGSSCLPMSCDNLANGARTGGAAAVVALAAYGGATVAPAAPGDCTTASDPEGSLCDEGPDLHSRARSTKSSNDSGTRWSSGDGAGTGVLVIDLGAVRAFDEARVFQMFSDGKTTAIQLAVHAESGAPPPWDDAAWQVVGGGFQTIGPGSLSGSTVSDPTTLALPLVATRYLRVEARNDGSFGSAATIALRSLKLFGPCARSCWDIKVRDLSGGDGVYPIDADGPGILAPSSVYCDMTRDGGGWTKILQNGAVSYTPTTDAMGDIATSGVASFAKLADETIHAFGGSGSTYRLEGNRSSTRVFFRQIPPGGPLFDDTAPSWGVGMGSLLACRADSIAGCAWSTVESEGVDTLAWGISDNDCGRYFTDYGSQIGCYKPSSGSTRCVSTGASCNDHDPVDEFAMWVRPPRTSCLDILNGGESVGDGVYDIAPGGPDVATISVYCDMTTDGGGWTLVRRRDHTALGWHPIDDDLTGISSYGTPIPDPTADTSFSLSFDASVWPAYRWSEYLLSFGDQSRWVVITAAEMATGWDLGCFATTRIERSETRHRPYSLNFCKRPAAPEDPWISTNCDHFGCPDTAEASMIYGEGSYYYWEHARQAHVGANVFVR